MGGLRRLGQQLLAEDGRFRRLLKAAAPACYITNWEDQLQGTGPQDAEQQFPDYLRNGFNHGDLIIAALPKPYLMCSTEQDFFPIEGAQRQGAGQE